MPVTVHGLDRLIALADVAGDIDKSSRRELRKAVKGSLEPVVGEARSAYGKLPGPGSKAARTVRIHSSGDKVVLSTGSASVPTSLPSEFGVRNVGTLAYQWSNQFGRGIEFSGVKRIDYRRSFGAYTGTRGKAFLPAVRRGLRRANGEADGLAREWVERIAQAG